MPDLKLFLTRRRAVFFALLYAGFAGFFLWLCAQFHLPGKGFTYLIEFGDAGHARYLPEVRAIDHYEMRNSPGYDAQAYAQIAIRPRLGDPDLRRAVDNLPYRARRILFCWTAYLLGLGDPVRVLNIYALQNIFAWLILAALLCRWFPPAGWGNAARWIGVMFSYGLCVSVRGSLVDGPSLLLLALGMAALEAGRPWLATAVFGLSGLGRETNVLGAAALVGRSRPTWLIQAALACLPLAVWSLVLWLWLDRSGSAAGSRNFAWPFQGYFGKWAEIGRTVKDGPAWTARGGVLIQAGLTVQWLFFALRPRWRDPWWRLGAAYAALMVVLGPAVWENFPGAAVRVLLPMTLAFNVLLPREKWAWALLLLGNLSVLVAPDALPLPGRESYVIRGAAGVEVRYEGDWYPAEKSWFEYWRWSRGPAILTFRDTRKAPVTAEIDFGLRADDARNVSIRQDGKLIWEGTLAPGKMEEIKVPAERLEPGDTVWRFSTDRPPAPPTKDDPRPVAFSVRNLTLTVK